MRLLLDECVPRPLLRDLTGHDAHHVVDLGWSSKRNSELLTLMIAERFEALFTVDRNLPFQQNLRASGIIEPALVEGAWILAPAALVGNQRCK